MPEADPAQASSAALSAAFVEMAADLVGAYVAGNPMPAAELPDLLVLIHRTLVGLGSPAPEPAVEARPTPPVSVRKSIGDDFLVSMEDGNRYKSLKRHLATRGLTPAEYRAKWGLPADYPMVAPAYARQRSDLAKSMGLGQLRRKR